MDLSGAWELEKERSQSMYPHMKLLGCDEIAALASEKLNLTMHINQTATRISVWQRSQLGIVHRGLHIGQPTTEVSSQGERTINVAVTPESMVVESRFALGALVDTRTLETDAGTGDVHLRAHLKLTVNDGSVQETTRFFKKTGLADQGIMNTPPEGIATSSGLPPMPPPPPAATA